MVGEEQDKGKYYVIIHCIKYQMKRFNVAQVWETNEREISWRGQKTNKNKKQIKKPNHSPSLQNHHHQQQQH